MLNAMFLNGFCITTFYLDTDQVLKRWLVKKYIFMESRSLAELLVLVKKHIPKATLLSTLCSFYLFFKDVLKDKMKSMTKRIDFHLIC